MTEKSQSNQMKNFLAAQYEKAGGIFRLTPTWVARNSMPPGGRLGLTPQQYTLGERGWISERWLASTTRADNPIGPSDEGLSYLRLADQSLITLKEAVEHIPTLIMGEKYHQTHQGLNRLAKLFDMSDRISFHYHQQQADAQKVNRNPKEEAYYFPPGVDMGPHPETFFGFHPSFLDEKIRGLILKHLVDWRDDRILQHSRAYQLFPDDGFHVPAGIPHAPGTALTLELQEDSDVFSVMQAKSGESLIPKELLYKDVSFVEREQRGEKVILEQINWELSCDPYFYENRHTPPVRIEESIQNGGEEYWIFYNTTKFSGKKLIVKPGMTFTSQDKGVYNLLTWQGQGVFAGIPIQAGDFDREEILVCHDHATQPLIIHNTGEQDLILFKFFGPDINPDVPMVQRVDSSTKPSP